MMECPSICFDLSTRFFCNPAMTLWRTKRAMVARVGPPMAIKRAQLLVLREKILLKKNRK
jgi:hypothetical protein